MELGQLVNAVRDLLDDHSQPPLYGDDELTRYLNNAVAEACLRARLLQDDTSALTQLPVTAGTASYKFNPAIFGLQAVHLSGRREPLIRCTAAYLDREAPGWRHMPPPPSAPRFVVLDLQQRTLVLYPTPDADGTLFLRVWRQPIEVERMEEDDDEPVVVLTDAEQLKHWACYEAFMKKDSELYDADKAAQHLQLFTDRFGDRPSEHALMLWSTQVSGRPRRNGLDY